MSYRKKMLNTIQGKKTEHIPFVPRLDNWYRANKFSGTLPERYKEASLIEIVDDLGVGYHTVMPDLQGHKDPLDDVDRALGIWRINDLPYRIILNNIKRNIYYEGDSRTVEYLTPHGNIKVKTKFSERAKKSGITLTDIIEKPIKDKNDFEAIAYIYENTEIIPQYDKFLERKKIIGDRGLLIALINFASCPMRMIQRYLMDYTEFFIKLKTEPSDLEWLANKLQDYFDQIVNVAINAPADAVFLGSNYDRNITPPPFFKEYILPSLKKYSEKAHNEGKYFLTHTDGENRGLLEYYLESNIDIADSVCPTPMTDLTFKDHKDVFKDKITIWGGIPSVSLLEDSMSEKSFDELLNDFFENQIGKGDHLIVSIADTAPPNAKFSRIEKIAKKCKEFGPINS